MPVNGTTKEIDYIYLPDGEVIVLEKTGTNRVAHYVHTDHLESFRTITDANKDTLAQYTYDVWGKRTLKSGTEQYLRGFTGHEHLDAFGIINMNGRVYDPITAQFFSPDPYVQAPGNWLNYNRYSYCLNNPLMYTDPSGEFFFAATLLGTLLNAACWGATISAVSYTASVAMSDGGFKNWNWKQFGKSAGFGALSGAVTFGIGEVFQAAGNFAGSFGTEALRGVTHGLAQGGISALQGGNFWTGFASGTLSSWVASDYSLSGLDKTLGDAGMYGFSAFSGGVASAATGGDFWQGAATGLITAGLNHVQHKVEEYKFFHRLRKHYDKGTGTDFKITKREFEYLQKKGEIKYSKAKDMGDGLFNAPINFYNSDLDLRFSFGEARIFYDSNGKFVDFYDYYNFDSQPWGKGRSIPNEIITRAYGWWSNGKPFHIYYKNLYNR